MYSVQQLSKMYSCTRATMYAKLKHVEIQQYIHKDDEGLKLMTEGLNVLNTIISGSKIKPVIHEIHEVSSELNTKHTDKSEYIDRYINSLEEQISELKLDKEKLFNELESQRKILLLVMPEQTEPVIETTIQDAIQQTKKSKWKFWQ